MERNINYEYRHEEKAVPSGTASFAFSFTESAGSGIRTLCFGTTVLGQPISAQILIPDAGIHVSVCGGEKSHIGAVSIIAPDGSRSDIQFPGHKDGVIASKWASALYEAGYCPVVACAGIHYDNLSREGIQTVVSAADQLLSQVLQLLRES